MAKTVIPIDGTYYEYDTEVYKRLLAGDEPAPEAVLRYIIKVYSIQAALYEQRIAGLESERNESKQERPRRTRKVQEGSQSTKSEDGSA